MIGYVTIGTNDFDTALPFYDAVLGALGQERKSFDGAWAFYGGKDSQGDVGLCKPFDGGPATAGNGMMIAFVAGSPAEVEAGHAAGLAAGGTDEGAPGGRPEGGAFFGAYLRDPTGNKLCLFHVAA